MSILQPPQASVLISFDGGRPPPQSDKKPIRHQSHRIWEETTSITCHECQPADHGRGGREKDAEGVKWSGNRLCWTEPGWRYKSYRSSCNDALSGVAPVCFSYQRRYALTWILPPWVSCHFLICVSGLVVRSVHIPRPSTCLDPPLPSRHMGARRPMLIRDYGADLLGSSCVPSSRRWLPHATWASSTRISIGLARAFCPYQGDAEDEGRPAGGSDGSRSATGRAMTPGESFGMA